MSKQTDKIVDDHIRDLTEENELLRAILKRHLAKGCELHKKPIHDEDNEPYVPEGYE